MDTPPGQVTLRRDYDVARHAESIAVRLVSRRLLGEYANLDVANAVARQAAEEIVEQGLRFEIDVDAVVPHGHVVLIRRQDDARSAGNDGARDMVVVDLRIDDLALAPKVCRLVEEAAIAAGAPRLAIALPPGDLVRTAFIVGAGFHPVSFQLRLDLDHDMPAKDRVVLREAVAGTATSKAPARPPGEAHVLVGHDVLTDAVIGTVLVSTARPMVLLRDIRLPARLRGQGFALALLRAAAHWSRQRGSHALGVQLRADDHALRGAVDQLGFRLVEEYCVKDLVKPSNEAAQSTPN